MTIATLAFEAPVAPADRFARVPAPFGDLWLTGNGEQLLTLGFSAPDLTGLDEGPMVPETEQLTEYLAGERRSFELRLAPLGHGFPRRVWAQLLTIDYGRTASYGDIAHALGQPGAARAVGAANHVNPIALVVPCHRVIGADGSLTGFGGGLMAKRFLLDLEADTLF